MQFQKTDYLEQTGKQNQFSDQFCGSEILNPGSLFSIGIFES